MDAKEKALKLCQSFGLLGMKSEQTGFYTLDLELSKECARIAVEQIIMEAIKYSRFQYWSEVLEEIKKL